MSAAIRQQIDDAINENEWACALALLRSMWRESPSLSIAQYVLDRVSKLDAPLRKVECRVAVLRSYTLDPVIPLLRASASLYGLNVSVRMGDFNTYVQDILSPDSFLTEFDAHVVILAVQTRDLVPDLWTGYTGLNPADVQQIVEGAVSGFNNWITAFRSRSNAHLIVHNLECPASPNSGVSDAQNRAGQIAAIRALNSRLQTIAAENRGVYVLDYDALTARHGKERWHDERKWLTARLPIAAESLIHMSNEYLRFLLPIMGLGRKALVVDLDNTLWGGVIGEDGPNGIRLSAEYPGAAFVALQNAILDLYRRGVILAVCSKNNPEDAMDVMEQNPCMILRPSHFASMRINWTDKAQNLREIAAELNIGLDSLAFLDDNPAERERVRAELPEVHVIELPPDLMDYAKTLHDDPVFERVALSMEDKERGKYYAEQRQRIQLEQNSDSLEDYYRSLQMAAQIAPVNSATLARTAQLTQKTNQFNLTTRRYSEQDLAAMAADPRNRVWTISLKDRFGDNGVVGVAITMPAGDAVEIDTFLLSCRVIGRTLETAIVAALAADAIAHGAAHLRGWFLLTKKNAPAREFYPSHGFACIAREDRGELWNLELASSTVNCPEWIDCTVSARKD